MVKSERQFAGYLESQGKAYVSQPKTFRFNGTSYRPDFYCPEDDIYYEVKTVLLFSEAKKLLLFKKCFPYIKLKIVSPNGFPFYHRSTSKYLEFLEDKLKFIKSKDVLEISVKEFNENMKNFPYCKIHENSEQIVRKLPCPKEMIKHVNLFKEKLGISQ